MGKNPLNRIVFPVVDFFVIEKNQTVVNRIKKALSSKQYRCIGVAVVGKYSKNILMEIPFPPDVFLVGNVENPMEVVFAVKLNFPNVMILRVYDKTHLQNDDSLVYVGTYINGFIVL
ncbi:hypothetical protein ACFSKL_10555 [Belliella marina]|uniref:Uncharacterized protein n=1 Tax=Belliella marina TaxID=1644146 RepID=A0ABW4VM16_9BACT